MRRSSAILREVGDDIPVQLGGGIRDLDTIERYIDDGLRYVIIGTAAVKNPGFLKDACTRLRRPHHRRPRRQGRQGRHRRLEQAHRPRGGRPRQEVRGLRRRVDHLHRHRPRRHAVGHQHRGHRQAGAGADHSRSSPRAACRTWPTSSGCARSSPKASKASSAAAPSTRGDLDFAAAQARADELRRRRRRAERAASGAADRLLSAGAPACRPTAPTQAAGRRCISAQLAGSRPAARKPRISPPPNARACGCCSRRCRRRCRPAASLELGAVAEPSAVVEARWRRSLLESRRTEASCRSRRAATPSGEADDRARACAGAVAAVATCAALGATQPWIVRRHASSRGRRARAARLDGRIVAGRRSIADACATPVPVEARRRSARPSSTASTLAPACGRCGWSAAACTRDRAERELHRNRGLEPGPASIASLADLPDDGWRHMLCVEAAASTSRAAGAGRAR